MPVHSTSIAGWQWIVPLLLEDLRGLHHKLLGTENLSEDDTSLTQGVLDKTSAILGFFQMPMGLAMVDQCRQALSSGNLDATLKTLWRLGNYLDAVGEVELLRQPQNLTELPVWVEARLAGLNSELRHAVCGAMGEDIVRLRDGMDLHAMDPSALGSTDWESILQGILGTLRFLSWDEWATSIRQARGEWAPGQPPEALADLLVRLETWLPLKLFGPLPPATHDVLPHASAQEALAVTMLVSLRSAKESLRNFTPEALAAAREELWLVQAALRTVEQPALADMATAIGEELGQAQGHTPWTRYALAALEGNLERLDGLLPWLLEDSSDWHAPTKATPTLHEATGDLVRLGQPWIQAHGAGDTLSVLDAILRVRAAALNEHEAELANKAGEAAIHVEHEEIEQSVAAVAELLPRVEAWKAAYDELAELAPAIGTVESPQATEAMAEENGLEEAPPSPEELEEEVVDALSFWWPSLKRPDQSQFWMALHACGQALQGAGHEDGPLFLMAAQARTLDAQIIAALDGLKSRLPVVDDLSPPTLVRLLKANLEMAQNALSQQTPRSFWRLMAEHAALLAEAEGRMETNALN